MPSPIVSWGSPTLENPDNEEPTLLSEKLDGTPAEPIASVSEDVPAEVELDVDAVVATVPALVALAEASDAGAVDEKPEVVVDTEPSAISITSVSDALRIFFLVIRSRYPNRLCPYLIGKNNLSNKIGKSALKIGDRKTPTDGLMRP